MNTSFIGKKRYVSLRILSEWINTFSMIQFKPDVWFTVYFLRKQRSYSMCIFCVVNKAFYILYILIKIKEIKKISVSHQTGIRMLWQIWKSNFIKLKDSMKTFIGMWKKWLLESLYIKIGRRELYINRNRDSLFFLLYVLMKI